MDEGQVITGSFFVAGGNAAVVFETVDKSFGEIAEFIFSLVPAAFVGAIGAWWNHRFSAPLPNHSHPFVAVICFIGNYTLRCVWTQEFLGPSQVVFFARTQPQFNGLTLGVYGQVELGTETAPRPSQRFGRRVFL